MKIKAGVSDKLQKPQKLAIRGGATRLFKKAGMISTSVFIKDKKIPRLYLGAWVLDTTSGISAHLVYPQRIPDNYVHT